MLVLLTIAIEFRYSTMLSYNFDIITFNRNALASTKKTRTGTTVPPDKFSPSDKTSKQRVAPETTCCNTSHASSSSCSGPYSSNFGILSSSQGACPLELDLFETILRGRWTTVHFIPPSLRDLWAGVFTTALSQFNTSPTLRSFARLSATTKVLLAAPKHDGKAREDATERCIRARINMWMGGRENEVCLQVIKKRKKKTQKRENSNLELRKTPRNQQCEEFSTWSTRALYQRHATHCALEA